MAKVKSIVNNDDSNGDLVIDLLRVSRWAAVIRAVQVPEQSNGRGAE